MTAASNVYNRQVQTLYKQSDRVLGSYQLQLRSPLTCKQTLSHRHLQTGELLMRAWTPAAMMAPSGLYISPDQTQAQFGSFESLILYVGVDDTVKGFGILRRNQ